ncbi:hypothetical protein, partial [Acinetobacter gandensis]|uniref:hypothetical protein n=1 Tax=Acinetobacter gandensis TaxID=1443941 RepID=UPI003F55C828
MNASLIDQNEIIQQVVVFPFRFRSLSLVEGHWEFFRRYMAGEDIEKFSVHDKFHRILVLSGFFFLKIASTFLNSSF